jgi:hypothetical protein
MGIKFFTGETGMKVVIVTLKGAEKDTYIDLKRNCVAVWAGLSWLRRNSSGGFVNVFSVDSSDSIK